MVLVTFTDGLFYFKTPKGGKKEDKNAHYGVVTDLKIIDNLISDHRLRVE